MATNHTSHYGLSQWLATDPVLRADFNADNAAIDTALNSLNTTTQQHTMQIAQHAAQLSQKGDCTFYFTSYTGTNEHTRTLTFPSKPVLTLICCQSSSNVFCIIEGVTSTGSNGFPLKATWEGATLTMTNTDTGVVPGFNRQDEGYSVLALLRAGE